MKYPSVMIKWIDATSESSWESLDDLSDDDFFVTDIGWIIKKTKKYTTICSEITQDGMFGNKTRVPNNWIKSIQEVKICPLKKPKLKNTSLTRSQPTLLE